MKLLLSHKKKPLLLYFLIRLITSEDDMELPMLSFMFVNTIFKLPRALIYSRFLFFKIRLTTVINSKAAKKSIASEQSLIIKDTKLAPVFVATICCIRVQKLFTGPHLQIILQVFSV